MAQATVPPNWISLPQTCLELGISWGQAYRLVLRGELEAKQVGRDWLVNPESIARAQKAVGRKVAHGRPRRPSRKPKNGD